MCGACEINFPKCFRGRIGSAELNAEDLAEEFIASPSSASRRARPPRNSIFITGSSSWDDKKRSNIDIRSLHSWHFIPPLPLEFYWSAALQMALSHPPCSVPQVPSFPPFFLQEPFSVKPCRVTPKKGGREGGREGERGKHNAAPSAADDDDDDGLIIKVPSVRPTQE